MRKKRLDLFQMAQEISRSSAARSRKKWNKAEIKRRSCYPIYGETDF